MFKFSQIERYQPCVPYTKAFRALFGGSAKINRDNLRALVNRVARTDFMRDKKLAWASLLGFFQQEMPQPELMHKYFPNENFTQHHREGGRNLYIPVKVLESKTLKLVKELFGE